MTTDQYFLFDIGNGVKHNFAIFVVPKREALLLSYIPVYYNMIVHKLNYIFDALWKIIHYMHCNGLSNTFPQLCNIIAMEFVIYQRKIINDRE